MNQEHARYNKGDEAARWEMKKQMGVRNSESKGRRWRCSCQKGGGSSKDRSIKTQTLPLVPCTRIAALPTFYSPRLAVVQPYTEPDPSSPRSLPDAQRKATIRLKEPLALRCWAGLPCCGHEEVRLWRVGREEGLERRELLADEPFVDRLELGVETKEDFLMEERRRCVSRVKYERLQVNVSERTLKRASIF